MNFKKLLGAVMAVTVLGASAVAYAAGTSTPADIVADLTGKPVESVVSQRSAGTAYGDIAKEAGVLPEFQEKMLALKKEVLQQRVEAGRLTEAEAARIYEALKDNQANCDGTRAGGNGIGRQLQVGSGFGGRMEHNGPGQQAGQGGQVRARNGSAFGLGFGRGAGK